MENPGPSFSNLQRISTLVVLLSLFGLVMLFSASGVLGLERHHNEFYYFSRQGITVCAGLVLMLALSFVPRKVWSVIAVPVLLAEISLVAATYVAPWGVHALGAQRWLKLGGWVFQPSEFAKIACALYLAKILERNQLKPFGPLRWGVTLFPFFCLLALIFKQPDLGTTALLIGMAFGLLFMAEIPWKVLAGILVVGLGSIGSAMAISPYRRRRVFAYINPWADPQGSGFQTIQSFLSLHSGGWFGMGLGNGNSKLFYLPEVHTDFVFALVGEELGFVGAFGVLLGFAGLGYLLLRTTLTLEKTFDRLVAYGLTLSLLFQILVNLGGVTGLLPIKGLPLPFFSWGRTALLTHFISIGIVLSLLRSSTKK